jgi:hypothetical protein
MNFAFDDLVRDRFAGETTRVSVSSTGAEGDGSAGGPVLSADGRYVAFNSGASNQSPPSAVAWASVPECHQRIEEAGWPSTRLSAIVSLWLAASNSQSD